MSDGRLIIEGRGNWAYTFWLGDHSVVRMGRGPLNDLTISDLAASTVHAEISLEDGQYILRDLRSSNGTFVDGIRIKTDYKLRNGATIKIGNTQMSFLRDAAMDESAILDPQTLHDRGLHPEESTNFQGGLPLEKIESEIDSAHGKPQTEADLKRFRSELERAKTEMEMLSAQNTLFRLLSANKPENERLDSALSFVASQLEAENGFIMQVNPTTHKWVVRARYGQIRDWAAEDGPPPLSLTVVEKAVGEGEPIFSANLSTDSRVAGAASIVRLNIRASMTMPLKRGAEVRGVLYLDRRDSEADFSDGKKQQCTKISGFLSDFLFV